MFAVGVILVVLQSGLLEAAMVGQKSTPAFIFRARLSTGRKVGLRSNVRFDQINANEGDWYNPTSGVLTAPVSGWYEFMFHAQSQTSGSSTFTLINEGKVEISTSIHGGWDCASFSTIIHVKQGHHVSIRKTYDKGNAEMYFTTQLSAYLLRRD